MLISRRLLTAIVLSALALPITLAVLVGVAALLEGMNDAAGAHVLRRLALGCGVLWAIDLIVLLLAIGVRTVGGSAAGEEEPRRNEPGNRPQE